MTALPPSTSTDVTTTSDPGAAGTTTTETPAGSAVTVTPVEAVPVTDRTTVRIVVIAIALIVLVPMVTSCVRSLVYDEPLPLDSWDLAKLLGGALIGVLASTRSVKN